MVSYLFVFPPSVGKLSLRLFDLILSKTRYCNHITFIIRCLFKGVIPHAFRSSFDFITFNSRRLDRRYSYDITSTCSSHSRRLMRITINSMKSQ